MQPIKEDKSVLRVYENRGIGWIHDHHYSNKSRSPRSILPSDENAKSFLKAKLYSPYHTKCKDLRRWCPAVKDQKSLFSSSIHAVIAMIEFSQKRNFGRYIPASALFCYKVSRNFCYKVSRNLLHLSGNTGAYVRTAMAASTLFGLPPEEYWPYIVKDFDKEPPAFVYSLAQNYKITSCLRLDKFNISKELLLSRIKSILVDGYPIGFSFIVYTSIDQATKTGRIPFPCPKEKAKGGHSVLAVGYDDNLKIVNDSCGKETRGAFHIQNSWGTKWGERGFGYIPYEYVIQALATDWWTSLDINFVDLEEFGLNLEGAERETNGLNNNKL